MSKPHFSCVWKRLPPPRELSMYRRTIGLTRERATNTRLMRLAREVGARVPCEGATVQATVQSATTAGSRHSTETDTEGDPRRSLSGSGRLAFHQ
jgi:hypothetical protein